jgi:hypothetical protein
MRIVALLLCLGMAAVAVACGSDSDETSPSATSPAGTAAASVSQTPASVPPASDLSQRGEEVERVADTSVQRVTWADGTVYEETIPTLILRTLGQPDAPSGRRVLASWLEGERWQVTIFTHLEDRSTDPPTVTDLRAEFYYDEGSGTFEAANGRASFALTGRDPCASDKPSADLCPLDKAIGSQ